VERRRGGAREDPRVETETVEIDRKDCTNAVEEEGFRESENAGRR
jgi:hypothetical protein